MPTEGALVLWYHEPSLFAFSPSVSLSHLPRVPAPDSFSLPSRSFPATNIRGPLCDRFISFRRDGGDHDRSWLVVVVTVAMVGPVKVIRGRGSRWHGRCGSGSVVMVVMVVAEDESSHGGKENHMVVGDTSPDKAVGFVPFGRGRYLCWILSAISLPRVPFLPYRYSFALHEHTEFSAVWYAVFLFVVCLFFLPCYDWFYGLIYYRKYIEWTTLRLKHLLYLKSIRMD